MKGKTADGIEWELSESGNKIEKVVLIAWPGNYASDIAIRILDELSIPFEFVLKTNGWNSKTGGSPSVLLDGEVLSWRRRYDGLGGLSRLLARFRFSDKPAIFKEIIKDYPGNVFVGLALSKYA